MNLRYHIHKSSVTCPYCDKTCHDDDYIVGQELETQVEFECEHCGKTFWAESCIVYSTYSDCKLNNEEHQFRQSEAVSALFQCDNCYQYEVRNTN